MFCARYVGAGGAGVRRACLSLVRKMVHYAPAPRLRALSSPRAAALLARLVAQVLDAQVSRRRRRRARADVPAHYQRTTNTRTHPTRPHVRGRAPAVGVVREV